jgi:RHS repeat-associated protein
MTAMVLRRTWTGAVRTVIPLALFGVCGLAASAEQPPPAVLYGSVRVSDGSTPPTGRYRNPDYPRYDDHPTVYRVSGANVLYSRILGNPIPDVGASSFEGTTTPSPAPHWFAAVPNLPGERWVGPLVGGSYFVSPYFVADKLIVCNDVVCQDYFDAELYAKWGNARGQIQLEDGTPMPWPVTVRAVPADLIPPGLEAMFEPSYTVSAIGTGEFSFLATSLVAEPGDSACSQANTFCKPIPIPATNNWGLRVLGDGGVRAQNRALYSNTSGSFPWRIRADVFDSHPEQPVTIESSQEALAVLRIKREDMLKVKARRDADPKNRPEKHRCERMLETEASPHPVSLITGNVFLDQDDASLPGLYNDLTFARSYNSFGTSAGSLGIGWQHNFEMRIEALSSRYVMVWKGNGAAEHYTDPDGDGVLTPYGSTGQPSTVTASAGGGFVRSFRSGETEEYRADGRLVKLSDRLGRSTVLEYDENSDLRRITSPEGRELRLEYGWSGGTLKRLLGPEGVIAEYDVTNAGDAGPHLEKVRYSDGTGYRFTYDDSGRLLTVTDLGGVVLERHGYAADGKAAWSELNGGRERHDYVFEEGRTVVTDARGNTSVFEIESKLAGRYISAITGCGFCGSATGTRRWEHDDAGRVTKYMDDESKETIYTYDGEYLASETNPLNQTTTYEEYDTQGRPHRITVPGYGTTILEYVPEGLRSVRLPGGQTTTYTYENGRPKSIQTGEGTTYTLAINARGELASVTDARGKSWTYSYDVAGRPKSMTAPDGGIWRTIWDVRGRPLASVRPDGKKVEYAYNSSGRLKSVTDAAGGKTSYAYDAYGRFDSVVDPLGRSTRFGYDAMSNLISLTDGNSRTTRFERDQLGRVWRTIDPMGGADELAYYPTGRIHTVKDRKGQTTTLAYDDIGRLMSRTHDDGTPGLSISRDDLARTVTFGNGTDTVTLAYDVSGRLVSEASTLNGSTVTYGYDDDHRLEAVTLIGQLVTRYGYQEGYLRQIDGTGAGQWSLSYDEAGRRQQLVYPNRVTTAYEYEAGLGWLRAIRAARGSNPVLEVTYSHDLLGNRVSKAMPEGAETYGYDAASQLLSAARTGSPLRASGFSYDGVGNRVSETVNGVTRGLSHDARNRLGSRGAAASVRVSGTTNEPAAVTVDGLPARQLAGNAFQAEAAPTEVTVEARDASGNLRTNQYQLPAPEGATTFGYDANGDLTSKTEGGSTWTYEWDALSQLTRVWKDGAEVARFEYDPLGRRLRKVAGGITYSYLYAGMDILKEIRSDGSTTTTYTYVHGPGIDEPLARIDGSGTAAYFHADGLGSVVKMTDSTGTVVQTRQYDPWGSLEHGADQPGYAFTGREWDPETGLYYYRARYYDPKLGRFISEDPIGFLGGVDFYAYVGGNPANAIDSFGLVNLNLFNAQDPARESANRYNPSGWFTVAGHADIWNVYDKRSGSEALTVAKLAEAIRDAGWQPGQQIELLACHAGKGPEWFPNFKMESVAARLAHELNTTVWAPDKKVWWHPTAHAPDFYGVYGEGSPNVINWSDRGQMLPFVP